MANTYVWRTHAARKLHQFADRVTPPPPKGHLRRRVGGEWDKLGTFQFEYLKEAGLEPHHRMLDVGCGTMRGGIHFARYLEARNYFGVDIAPEMLEGGRDEMRAVGLDPAAVTLRVTDTFDVDFSIPFDFALAQSVFTHVPLNSIQLCLENVAQQLAPGGRFYATFFRGPADNSRRTPINQPSHEGFSSPITYCDRNNYHYSFDDLRYAASAAPLEATDIGEWDHPRGQQMALFTRI